MQSGDNVSKQHSGTVGLHVTQAFYTLRYTLPDEMPLVQHFARAFIADDTWQNYIRYITLHVHMARPSTSNLC